MSQKSQALYRTPFSKAYWRDAAAELKDVRMLVFAALMVALRVALKGVYIPLAPNLNINIGFFVNALGAMIFGPVVAILGACVSDTLGCLIFPQGVYFFPFIFEEIAGSLIFALLLYRTEVTPTRVILSRFSICFFVNIVMNAPLMWWYYKLILGKSYVLFQLPNILKNLFLFPIESVVLTLFLGAMIPVAHRLGLVYDKGQQVKFRKRQIAVLAALFLAGSVSVGAYLSYYYDNTSLSAAYSAEERYAANCSMDEVIRASAGRWEGETTVSVVESAYKRFLGSDVTYTVAVYTVEEDALGELEALRGLSKSKAAAHEGLRRAATAVIVQNQRTGEVLSFTLTETGQQAPG